MWLPPLKEFKRESGKTIKQISEESGVPLGTLNKLFAGQTKDPKLETLRAVVHCLGHTIDDLCPPNPKNDPANLPVDEADLNEELISRLCQLTPEEMEKVDAFVQGLLAAR